MDNEEKLEEENLFSDDFWIGCGSEEELASLPDVGIREEDWTPRYPIDMEHPVELTEEQLAHADALIEAIDRFFDANPEDSGVSPLLRITQKWEVDVTRGAHMNFTDWVDPLISVMCHEERGYYVDYGYLEQCVPFIEKELEEMAAYGNEGDEVAPSCRQQELDKAVGLEMELMGILSQLDPAYGYDNILIAVDRVMPEVYAIPTDVEHDDYGGLIHYYRADTFMTPDGSIDIDRVKEAVGEGLKPW